MKKKLLIMLTAFFALLIFGGASAYASCNVVTLMYHNVTNDSERWDDYCISPSTLDSDISYFLNNGYITMTASELATEDMSKLDGKKVLLLTFDDGYSGWYTDVYPILKKYSAKATMYIVGSKIDHYGYLTSYQIKELANSGLVEMGNHTDKIHQTPVELVKRLYDDTYSFWDIVDDIRLNGEKITAITGKPVTSISWPYGYYTSALDNAVKDNLGYKISFSTNYGVTVYSGSAATPLNRINREYSTTSQSLYERAESKF
jgi:peptidoglycan/xylan/chitin deacetylase (PgdA/CDA1 family)